MAAKEIYDFIQDALEKRGIPPLSEEYLYVIGDIFEELHRCTQEGRISVNALHTETDKTHRGQLSHQIRQQMLRQIQMTSYMSRIGREMVRMSRSWDTLSLRFQRRARQRRAELEAEERASAAEREDSKKV